MRGKEDSAGSLDAVKGIIPAYAGKSMQRYFYAGLFKDHPRVCGEKSCQTGAASLALGSSPRMRGKVACLVVHQFPGRIIPAYAGKSMVRRSDSRLSQGSSPRMRGKGPEGARP